MILASCIGGAGLAVSQAREVQERQAAKDRQREHGGTAPGKAKNTSAKFAPVLSGKSRAKVARASAGTMKKIETSRQSRRKVSAPCAPPALVVQRKRPQPMFCHRLEPKRHTRWSRMSVSTHRTNPHSSTTPGVRLAARGGARVAPTQPTGDHNATFTKEHPRRPGRHRCTQC